MDDAFFADGNRQSKERIVMEALFQRLRRIGTGPRRGARHDRREQRLHAAGRGRRMLVTAAGRVCGTIGGGMLEYRSESSRGRCAERRERAEHFRLRKNAWPTSAWLRRRRGRLFPLHPAGEARADAVRQIETLFARRSSPG
jgi:hypothetical protein